MKKHHLAIAITLLLVRCAPEPGLSRKVTVLYNDRTVELEQRLADPNDLWVSPSDLTRINNFILKPEGACLDDLCIPVLQDEDSALMVTRQSQEWFNVSELARVLRQPFVVDHATDVWSFGPIPHTRTSFLENAQAPEFSLLDRDGNQVNLSDFLGKKVMLVTWASW